MKRACKIRSASYGMTQIINKQVEQRWAAGMRNASRRVN